MEEDQQFSQTETDMKVNGNMVFFMDMEITVGRRQKIHTKAISKMAVNRSLADIIGDTILSKMIFMRGSGAKDFRKDLEFSYIETWKRGMKGFGRKIYGMEKVCTFPNRVLL